MPFPSQKFNSLNVWVDAKKKKAPTQQRRDSLNDDYGKAMKTFVAI